MARAYTKVTNDDRFWIERDDDGDYNSPLRFITHRDDGPPIQSTTLTTYEIGLLASQLMLIYYRRTGKLSIPQDLPREGTELVTFKEPDAQPVENDCVFCDGECNGDCL